MTCEKVTMAAVHILPTQTYLQTCLDYDTYTGVLTWKQRPAEHFPTKRTWKIFNTQFAGKEAGGLCVKVRYTHRTIVVNNIKYACSRVIYKLMTNEDPPEVDHWDRNPLNNRWCNLRAADRSNNAKNQKKRIDNSTGFKGVTKIRNKDTPYVARIKCNKIKYEIGKFKTPEEAYSAYCEAAKRLHGEFYASGF